MDEQDDSDDVASSRRRTVVSAQMHEHEIPLSVAQVTTIVREQFPQWGDLPVRPVAGCGTVNRIFRLGDMLSARFSLVVEDPDELLAYLQTENDAARELVGKTRFPSPEGVALGRPCAVYPGHWAVHTWLEGVPAVDGDLSGSVVLAGDVAEFIADVRAIPLQGRSFSGNGRGGDLRFSEAWMETCFTMSEHLLDVPRLVEVWTELRELPREGPDLMTHGDLLPGNLLVENQALVGVLDPAGLGAADPALDLMGLWSLFDVERRELIRRQLGCTDLEWARGQAWAFQQAMGAVWYYVNSNPTMSELGRRALEQISAAWAPY